MLIQSTHSLQNPYVMYVISNSRWEGTYRRFTHLMDAVDFSPRPDGLDSHNHSLQFPLSDVREPTACEYRLLYLVARQCTDKIAFRDLA